MVFNMSDNNSRAYYAIIPANVRYDDNLTANAKLLYGEITALCNEKGYCWANNSYFADLYKVSNVSISKWISELEEKGYLHREIIYKNGTKEILNRYLRIIYDPIKEKFNTPIKEKFKDNNTFFLNNTLNNTLELFIDFRKKIKKPMTDYSIKLLVDKLNKIGKTDQEKIEILNESIVNGWQGIFPIKNKGGGSGGNCGQNKPISPENRSSRVVETESQRLQRERRESNVQRESTDIDCNF